ncbi:hypothetical protein [Naasia lichenicola]|uniref:Uncharacterized protein n=1 Tax=Naasia lichenicola TaxID=2565933 RepID=A0A4S4FSI2_9MICO|nr:hypothetical protein [Naasia lichenicola]THG33261.1 hypothetical protein E6C64_02605 [Naasia lichenicola]
MGLFKSPEERDAAQSRKAEARWAASPIGKATAAAREGRRLLELEFDRDAKDDAADLESIEALGWRVEFASYYFVPNHQSDNSISGATRARYLFRWTSGTGSKLAVETVTDVSSTI